MKKKEYTSKEVREIIQEIKEFAGGIDRALDEYLRDLKKFV